MDIKELLQLILSAGATIDTLWNTFIGVHFALIIAIYFLDRDFTIVEKFILSAAYCIFAWLNYGALVSSYQIYASLISDAQAMPQSSYIYFKKTRILIASYDYTGKTTLVASVHIFALIIVTGIVFLKSKIVKPNKMN